MLLLIRPRTPCTIQARLANRTVQHKISLHPMTAICPGNGQQIHKNVFPAAYTQWNERHTDFHRTVQYLPDRFSATPSVDATGLSMAKW